VDRGKPTLTRASPLPYADIGRTIRVLGFAPRAADPGRGSRAHAARRPPGPGIYGGAGRWYHYHYYYK
jgi:hypothetical protein